MTLKLIASTLIMTCCFLRNCLSIQPLILFSFLFISEIGYSQPCNTPGQTPATALPVCGSTAFTQYTVPHCRTNNLFVPGCSDGYNNPEYGNKNAFWYRFVCSTSGTLEFLIYPYGTEEDYDWQLYNVTGHHPDDVYSDTSLVVAGNWAGSFGSTGTSSSGFAGINCASESDRFAQLPDLIEGHEYLLMVSCFTDGKSGYTLSFTGGTAVINDPADPHFQSANLHCGGKVTLKLNKKMRCNSLTPSGSEFTLSSPTASILAATAITCSAGALYFDEVTLTLSKSVAVGDHYLSINYGSDGNTLLDDCDRSLPAGEQVSFQVSSTQALVADSIGHLDCSPSSLQLYFPKRIDCSTMAIDGSDFIVTGPSPVTVIGAAGDCANGFSRIVTIRFSAPIYAKGNYSLTVKTGTDGTTINDGCGTQMAPQTLQFSTEDTVSARFTYSSQLGCRFNTVAFSHDGAHDVNSWNWRFNNSTAATTQEYTTVFAAASTNEAQLIVTNGTCRDTANTTLVMNNEVKADFDMLEEICPGDPLKVSNTSTGIAHEWQWSFGNVVSQAKDPSAQYLPHTGTEHYYNIKLKVTNNTLNCSDSVSKPLRVLSNCIVAVPSAFSPNGDGLNDFLYPLNAMNATDLEFKVFNRWGQPVFSTRNPQEKWNGKVNGITQPSGLFVWYLKYADSVTGQKVVQKGTAMLIR